MREGRLPRGSLSELRYEKGGADSGLGKVLQDREQAVPQRPYGRGGVLSQEMKAVLLRVKGVCDQRWAQKGSQGLNQAGTLWDILRTLRSLSKWKASECFTIQFNLLFYRKIATLRFTFLNDHSGHTIRRTNWKGGSRREGAS